MSGENLTCAPDLLENVSRLCTSSISWEVHHSLTCFPNQAGDAFSVFVGVWSIINSGVGLLGNGLTLLAIPYARKRKKYIVFDPSYILSIINYYHIVVLLYYLRWARKALII